MTTTKTVDVEQGCAQAVVVEPTIEVTAPSTLPGGLEFSVESGGERFVVRVVRTCVAIISRK